MDKSSPKVIKLRIKVPANVTVLTEFVKVPASLTVAAPVGKPGGKVALNPTSVMEMDLTSQKTGDWLRKKLVASSDCGNCCCVRG